MPAYNAERYIEEAISSILNQSFSDFELIIIDDCSTDATWKLIENHKKKDTRIRTFLNKENLGIAGNRNKGVSLVTGKYLLWQDADDVSLPERMQMQFKYLERNADVAIVGGYLELFNTHGTIGIRSYPLEDAEMRKCIFRYSPIAQPAAMLRVESLRMTGTYNLEYPPAEDLDMTFRLGQNYKLGNIGETLIRYRVSDNSATFTSLRKMEISTLKIRRKYWSSSAYEKTLRDLIYNLFHLISIWIVPAKFKIRLFNKFRNT